VQNRAGADKPPVSFTAMTPALGLHYIAGAKTAGQAASPNFRIFGSHI